MKKAYKIILGLLVTATIISSCSRKKDTFLSRNYHALSARDNALFNGFNALQAGRETLNQTYVDNYWEILPIERLEVSEEVILPGQSENENFNRAEEKAVIAIQKHGMNIKGKEANPQIDEAYLLLGKARYFDQRFVPALESFNYILYKYAASNKINQAKIWREKVNIRLENEGLAIKNLKRLLEQETLEKQDLADATSMLAQAYINTKSIDSALTQIDIAANATKNNDERGRYRFIQGQLYNKLGDKDSANIAFDRVIDLNRKTPRVYLISAHIEKAKNFDYNSGNKETFLELLTKLEENRENRPFLDKIYYQIADYHLQNKSDSLAIAYYNKSLKANAQDKVLKAKSYQTLGELYFNNTEYKEAGAYYDSTMTNLVENSKPYRVIKRKRENLDDVIRYEDIAKNNDSILTMVAMPAEEKMAFYQKYIDKLKAIAAAEKEKQEIAELNKGLVKANTKRNTMGLSNSKEKRGGPNAGNASSFYFYNPTTVAYGKNEFDRVWGNRKLADNWRWSSKKQSGVLASNESVATANATNEELYNPKFYIDQLPKEQKEIDSIVKERNYAYYQLGLIYKEKFKEYTLAKTKFNQLLDNNPEEKLILPTKYNLYKIYSLLNQNGEAEIAKNNIIKDYPESRYAAILKNPEAAAILNEDSPEAIYKNLYTQFENQEYAQVLTKIEEYITAFDGEPIVAKFELLKATTSGRLYGFEAYKKALNFVALTYANTPEGKQAKNLSEKVIPKLINKEFVSDSLSKHFKVIYTFPKANKQEISTFVKTLKEVIKYVPYSLSISTDVYNTETTLVVLHGLKSKEAASNFIYTLREEDRHKITKPNIAISSANYQIAQIHKNLDTYSKPQK
ncbi:MAG: tetratricopeptide repeat protein [Oceanihabitans sp.]